MDFFATIRFLEVKLSIHNQPPLLPPPSPRLGLCVVDCIYIQKKRGECPVTRSTSWGLRITRYVRTSNEEAPRNMYTNKVYETIIRISILLGYNEGCTRICLYTPEDIYDAIVLHIPWSLRSFKTARTKRSKRLFIYMKPHSRLPNLLRKRACICVASMQR